MSLLQDSNFYCPSPILKWKFWLINIVSSTQNINIVSSAQNAKFNFRRKQELIKESVRQLWKGLWNQIYILLLFWYKPRLQRLNHPVSKFCTCSLWVIYHIACVCPNMRSVQKCTVGCRVVQYNRVIYSTGQYSKSTAQESTVLYRTVQYSTG